LKLALKRAFLSAMIYPGLGQFKNGDKLKGWLFVFAATALVFSLLALSAIEITRYFKTVLAFSYPESPMSSLTLIGGFWGQLVGLFGWFLLMGILVWGAAGFEAYYTVKKRWGDIDESDVK
jgi:hypothetical protein